MWTSAKCEDFCLKIQEQVQKTNFLRMLDSYPDLSKYKGNLSSKQNIKDSWKNKKFGGSILNTKNMI